MKETARKEFGRKIKEARTAKKRTQAELAAMLSVTETTVRNWEKGLKTPHPENLENLGEVLGMDVLKLYMEGVLKEDDEDNEEAEFSEDEPSEEDVKSYWQEEYENYDFPDNITGIPKVVFSTCEDEFLFSKESNIFPDEKELDFIFVKQTHGEAAAIDQVLGDLSIQERMNALKLYKFRESKRNAIGLTDEFLNSHSIWLTTYRRYPHTLYEAAPGFFKEALDAYMAQKAREDAMWLPERFHGPYNFRGVFNEVRDFNDNPDYPDGKTLVAWHYMDKRVYEAVYNGERSIANAHLYPAGYPYDVYDPCGTIFYREFDSNSGGYNRTLFLKLYEFSEEYEETFVRKSGFLGFGREEVVKLNFYAKPRKEALEMLDWVKSQPKPVF